MAETVVETTGGGADTAAHGVADATVGAVAEDAAEAEGAAREQTRREGNGTAPSQVCGHCSCGAATLRNHVYACCSAGSCQPGEDTRSDSDRFLAFSFFLRLTPCRTGCGSVNFSYREVCMWCDTLV